MRGRARMIARLSLQNERIKAVALGSVRGAAPVFEVQRRVGALVLATGASPCKDRDRMLLSAERGRPVIAQIAEIALRSRIDHIRLVTGARAAEVRAATRHLGLKAIHDRAHQSGGAVSALKAGLRSLPQPLSAVLVLPGDQARLQPKVIYHILAAYARGEGEFIVPRYRTRSGYPVLIGARYWSEILKLPRQSSFRAIAQRFLDEITFLNVDSDSIVHGQSRAASRRSVPRQGRLRHRGR